MPNLYHVLHTMIDVNKVTKVVTQKRLFCILERDLDWELIITQHEPHKVDKVAFVIGPFPGVVNYTVWEPYKETKFRMQKDQAEDYRKGLQRAMDSLKKHQT